MKFSKCIAILFGLMGIALAVFAVKLGFSAMDAQPELVQVPEPARERAEALLDAVCEGDFTAAGEMFQGQPSLGVDRPAADEAGVLVWNAFVDSLSYEFLGECYATDSGVAWDVRLTALDMTSVTGALREHSQTLLSQRVEQAQDVSEIYDENNDYREEFVMDVLMDSVAIALEQDAQYVTKDFTLNLVYQQGQWWVVPEEALLEAISGGIIS